MEHLINKLAFAVEKDPQGIIVVVLFFYLTFSSFYLASKEVNKNNYSE